MLPDELLAEAKAAAVREHTTLTRLVEEGLRLRLRAANGERRGRAHLELPVSDGRGGLREGLSGLCNREFWDAMDEDGVA
ncbi:MAG: DUF2191 domain-containing protein [Armatimonadetes bacterium]|nr:DUF2191 domain-containing protein [Armatimonadota bacterium]